MVAVTLSLKPPTNPSSAHSDARNPTIAAIYQLFHLPQLTACVSTTWSGHCDG